MNDEKYLARPSKAQYEWQDMELGMFIHWFPNVGAPIGEPWDIEQQKIAAQHMTCPEYDPAQWVQSAIDLGAKYIVFVAKHNRGICRWRSEYGGLNFKYSPYKNGQGDPLRELSEECRKHGIRLGIYLAGYSKTFGAHLGGLTRNPDTQGKYNDIYRGWLTEVLSNYGDIIEVWFDGSIYIEVGDILRKYAPNAIVFQSPYANIRWVGQEDGYASDPAWCAVSRYDAVTGVSTQAHGDPDGDTWMPCECDASLKRDWGNCPDPARHLHTLDELMTMYYRSVGHGANLLINHSPEDNGRISQPDFDRMKEFGDEIRRRFSSPIAKTEGSGVIVTLDLGKKTPIDHVITMEELSGGQRIRSYVIEGFDGEKWKMLTSGVSVGHKKIDYFASTEVEKVRIRVTKHVGEPLIRSIAAFNVGTTPKLGRTTGFDEYKIGGYGTELYDPETRVATLKYDLGTYADGKGKYRVSFRDFEKFHPVVIREVTLEIGGTVREGLVTKAEDEPCGFDLIFPDGAENICLTAVTGEYERPVMGETVFYKLK